MVIVKFKKLDPLAVIPTQAHKGDAGWDIYGIENVILRPGQRTLIRTGLACAVPYGYEMQIRPRSGLAKNFGIEITNSPGTVDAPYRDEVGVIVKNGGSEPYTFQIHDRIAQAVFQKLPEIEVVEVNDLDETDRIGGFGSTGR